MLLHEDIGSGLYHSLEHSFVSIGIWIVGGAYAVASLSRTHRNITFMASIVNKKSPKNEKRNEAGASA